MHLIIGPGAFYPDLTKYDHIRSYKLMVPASYIIATNNGFVKTKEGNVSFKKGDVILTYNNGSWPIDAEVFKKDYITLSEYLCVKKKRWVSLYRLDQEMKVRTKDGHLLSGKERDYIVQADKHDYWILSNDDFKKTYFQG